VHLADQGNGVDFRQRDRTCPLSTVFGVVINDEVAVLSPDDRADGIDVKRVFRPGARPDPA